ncbi:hypothetical protein GCM10028805_36500 [Spirosoma harenae]
MIKLFNPNFKFRSRASQPVLIFNGRGRRREPKPPTFESPTYKPKKRYYTSLCQQPFSVYFDFQPKHKHRTSVGYVTFEISVAKRRYGPYLTNIWTTTKTFQNRRWIKITKESLVVQETILAILEKLEEGWAAYDQQGEPITGEMVLAASGLQEVKGEGGLHYAI